MPKTSSVACGTPIGVELTSTLNKATENHDADFGMVRNMSRAACKEKAFVGGNWI